MMLDIFADIEKEHGYHDQRFAIEHAQHMAQKDFERFAKLHVIASMQPYHAIDDGRWAASAPRSRSRALQLRVAQLSRSRRHARIWHRLACRSARSDSGTLRRGHTRHA